MVLQEPNNQSETRMMRGMAITETSAIRENEDGSFTVPSQTGKDVVYTVKIIENKFTCDCPDYTYRCSIQKKIDTCKHGYALKFWIATNTFLQNKEKPKVFADDSVQCDQCGSIRTIRYGKNAEKQIFKCKDCLHKFREPSLVKKSKYDPKLITLTLDLYFSGLSLRKVARSVNDHFGLELDFTTVYGWIKKYVPIISQYVNSLAIPESESKRWACDEVFVKMKDGIEIREKTNMAFLWNVMDFKTRYLLASKLSEQRDGNGAIQAFQEAIKNAHGLQPKIITTDALRAYGSVIPKVFDNKPWHKARQGVRKTHANNNRIERMNGTQRERIKVQRGWKSMETQIPEGMKIHYNFVKPHMGLQNRTPAQKIGVIDKKVKWMDLLQFALEK
ncbi:MAG: DDE-type integrase/transposase/recombinase [Nitrosotalea sp.]